MNKKRRICLKKAGINYTCSVGAARTLQHDTTEGRDVGGNPPVRQRDRAKDQDRKTRKRPLWALSFFLFLFQQPCAGALLPQFIVRVTQWAVAAGQTAAANTAIQIVS